MIEELLDEIQSVLRKYCAAKDCYTCSGYTDCMQNKINKLIIEFRKKYVDDGK